MTNGFLGLDVLEKIQQTAVEASLADVSTRVAYVENRFDAEQYLIVASDGTYREHRKSDPPRMHKLLSCADVVSYADYIANENGDGGSPIIWISPVGIIVTDDSDRLRNNRGTYELRSTDQFRKVSGLGGGPQKDGTYTQLEMLQLLRVDLARSFQNDQVRLDLVQQIRRLNRQVKTLVGQGQGSHETGLLNQQNEVMTWPDSLMLNTTVFQDPAFTDTYPVEVVLDVRPENPNNRCFCLSPVPADLTKAMETALELAGSTIRDQAAGVPVFLGSP